ncbi:MAG TPA: FAD/NAD(P)-binding protein, partial [Steroidobacteraceae bacterium]|nr:FAD/NAD(P)-binding protein [Steroidobacteraceae bacterium]
AELGAGVAYATRDYPYPLNVAAGQMSLDAAQPRDFLEYLRDTGIHAEAGDYLPRQVYGEYVRARFESARAAAAPHVVVTHRRARALRLQRQPEGFELWLDDGSALHAAEVVLALGNPPPATPPGCERLAANPRYHADPSHLDDLARAEPGSVLLVGSGLTMIDAALRLAAIRPRVKHIHVLSRHGRLPQAQTALPLPAVKPDVAGALESGGDSARKLFRAFRRTMEQALDAGGDWREVLALARPGLPALWRGLPPPERARFLRHARAVWDPIRHRVPAGPLAAVRTLQRLGVLDVHAGRLVELAPAEDGIEVAWRPRGSAKTRAWLVDHVVNCTGPETRADRVPDPLLQSLLSSGLLRRDALGLGIDAAADGRVISALGAPVDGLSYLGPWLRARDWEATAVPELRELATQLASRLHAALDVGLVVA